MSAERAAFKALAAIQDKDSQEGRALVTAALTEFFHDHPCVDYLTTLGTFSVLFNEKAHVDADEMEKLAKCLRALEQNLVGVTVPHVVPRPGDYGLDAA